MTPDERAHEIVLQFRRGIIDRWEDLESVIGSAIIAAEEDATTGFSAALRAVIDCADCGGDGVLYQLNPGCQVPCQCRVNAAVLLGNLDTGQEA